MAQKWISCLSSLLSYFSLPRESWIGSFAKIKFLSSPFKFDKTEVQFYTSSTSSTVQISIIFSISTKENELSDVCKFVTDAPGINPFCFPAVRKQHWTLVYFVKHCTILFFYLLDVIYRLLQSCSVPKQLLTSLIFPMLICVHSHCLLQEIEKPLDARHQARQRPDYKLQFDWRHKWTLWHLASKIYEENKCKQANNPCTTSCTTVQDNTKQTELQL